MPTHDSSAVAVTNPEELLYRQVHPSFIQAGRFTSQAFKPTRKDEGKLSVDQGSKTSAEHSFTLFTSQGWPSFGVAAITVGECNNLELQVVEDPLAENPNHALVDFSAFSESQWEKKSKMLKKAAEPRGFVYQP